MSSKKVTQLKQAIVAHCRTQVNSRIRSAEEAIRMAQQSANEETKSSAGDKYETGRAMAQLEIEKAAGQLAEAQKLMRALEHIDVGRSSNTVVSGSLVTTSQGHYFLSIPAGKVAIDDVTWYAISPSSPIGTALMGRNTGDTIRFNGKEIVLTAVA